MPLRLGLGRVLGVCICIGHWICFFEVHWGALHIRTQRLTVVLEISLLVMVVGASRLKAKTGNLTDTEDAKVWVNNMQRITVDVNNKLAWEIFSLF